MEDYNIMSNKELTEKYQKLVEEFTEAQTQLKENYETMVHCSNESNKIKEILNKRGTKI